MSHLARLVTVVRILARAHAKASTILVLNTARITARARSQMNFLCRLSSKSLFILDILFKTNASIVCKRHHLGMLAREETRTKSVNRGRFTSKHDCLFGSLLRLELWS
jgi:hypothetical protein